MNKSLLIFYIICLSKGLSSFCCLFRIRFHIRVVMVVMNKIPRTVNVTISGVGNWWLFVISTSFSRQPFFNTSLLRVNRAFSVLARVGMLFIFKLCITQSVEQLLCLSYIEIISRNIVTCLAGKCVSRPAAPTYADLN